MSGLEKRLAANGMPDVRYWYGREAYKTKGQHQQCQPKVPPDELLARRREFFQSLYHKEDE